MSGNKFGAVKKMYKDVIYDSTKEADYSAKLDLLRKAEDPKDRVVAKEIQKPFVIQIVDRHSAQAQLEKIRWEMQLEIECHPFDKEAFDLLLDQYVNLSHSQVFKYLLDFKVTYADGRVEHVDIKGLKRGCAYEMFRLKKKCVEAQYGIEIIER